jgi:F-type H+-transporting ATPase subunit b
VKVPSAILLWTACLLLEEGQALAQAGEGGRTVTQSGSLYNALWAIGIFLMLLAILGRFAWRPILRAIEQRERHLADTLDRAQAQQAESQGLLARYRGLLDSADAEANKRLEQARQAAGEAREKILAAARAEADEFARRATGEIQAAKEQVHAYAAELATRAAEKIIQKELNPQDQRRIVDLSLEQIRRRARQGGP